MRDIKSNHELPAFKWIVLAAFLVTVLSVTLNGSLKSFRDAVSEPHDLAATSLRIESDPYDVQPERGYTSPRNRVETGL